MAVESVLTEMGSKRAFGKLSAPADREKEPEAERCRIGTGGENLQERDPKRNVVASDAIKKVTSKAVRRRLRSSS